jgi:hypothetical protein
MGIVFVCYISYFLFLTAKETNVNAVALNKMQDIIIKTSGWGLFVISSFRNGKKSKDEQD